MPGDQTPPVLLSIKLSSRGDPYLAQRIRAENQIRWLEANHINIREVLAYQDVEVNLTAQTVTYIAFLLRATEGPHIGDPATVRKTVPLIAHPYPFEVTE